MAHDKKLDQAVALALDLAASKNGMTTVAEIRDAVRVSHPVRQWHPSDVIEAERDYLSKVIKHHFAATLSKEFIDKQLPGIAANHRTLLGEIPAWFFVRSINKWVFSLYASPEQWDEGQEMRMDMAESVLESAVQFRERAELLRLTGAKSLMDLLKRKQVA